MGETNIRARRLWIVRFSVCERVRVTMPHITPGFGVYKMKLPLLRSKCRPEPDPKRPLPDPILPSGRLPNEVHVATSDRMFVRIKPSFLDIDLDTPWGHGGIHI